MGEKIAWQIQNELVSATGLTDRGAKIDAGLWVLRKTIGYPAALVEIGFISNPTEEGLMKQDAWDDKAASAIARGFSQAVGVAYVDGGATTIVQSPEPSRGSAPTPILAPTVALQFTYPNNATCVNDDLFIRDANGVVIPGRQVDKGDRMTVLDVGFTKQLTFVEYPTPSGVRNGFVNNKAGCIQYDRHGAWQNGKTPETVYVGTGSDSKLGSLNPHETATLLYKKDGRYHIVYSTNKGPDTKSGFVNYSGGL